MPETITTVNPATGAPLAEYKAMTTAEIDHALTAATEAQTAWAALSLDQRTNRILAVAQVLRERQGELADLAVAEMGKPRTEALAEIEKCAWVCDHVYRTSAEHLAHDRVDAAGSESWTAYLPLGVVLAIMPWNFPFWQVFRFAAPALAAGNGALLKHSPNVTGCALAAQEVFEEAGLPAGLFTTLLVAEPDVPEVVGNLIADDRVAAVTLTGSNRAGAHVAAAAGKAVKKSVLELGGSDPFVVLDDADLDTVVPKAVASRFLNAGQSCLAAKRFLVHHSIATEFARRFADAVAGLRVGDPAADDTQIGPLARADLAQALHGQVERSVAAGATALTGGGPLGDRGDAWYAPTVLAGVTTDMPVMTEETFGPVAAVVAFDDDEDAARLANLTPYGLGASVWSRDKDRALRVGSRIQSGALFVNAVVASDPRLAFGGVKQSGYGRELGAAGAREFTNIRTVVVG
ncbi:NAD-dependent succinate-semialdehyde dehydrogenase [Amycolatopsis sp. Hca4]|uniref:NAD-dependent succinate-semialdehyde dehydrogenase n=1 Tax=Amycolatopsis sp. Hca4 TaxID=2742131 RepID=UPI001591F1C9|nr:NAD-dependent succinate-semialdehyde dehydrogenase [Amycolatopsis sp. Hca4]QKV75802.1 NAD-dependent succinate-semialdehyde dehydrogenase [Amycolatopsis sp. Hca4]